MKALEKDRNRRYETASAFAADVQRYLHDEPVQACPPSAWYRFRKFARRNKTALAVAGLLLFFIAIVGGGGGWVIRDRAAREEAVTKERLDREQRLTTQVEMILDDVDRLGRKQKWPEAQAAAARAEAALAGGAAGEAIRQRVRDVSSDLAFVARIDRIRQDRAHVIERKLNNRGAVEDYGRAFRAYGVDVETLPTEEAVARLRARPLLAVPVAAALDDWVTARRQLGEHSPNWKALVGVARGIDGDPLRDRLRAVWASRPRRSCRPSCGSWPGRSMSRPRARQPLSLWPGPCSTSDWRTRPSRFCGRPAHLPERLLVELRSGTPAL
jgi:hypothetical protein